MTIGGIAARVFAPQFKRWRGARLDRRIVRLYGRKPVLAECGRPWFAELLVVRMLRRAGWKAVWVDSWKHRMWQGMPVLTKPVQLPRPQADLLKRIQARVGGRGGCWDVFAWKGNRVLFAECKWLGHDAIRLGQVRWLKAALREGLTPRSFLVVEWRMNGHPAR